jgi:hypothetical protein
MTGANLRMLLEYIREIILILKKIDHLVDVALHMGIEGITELVFGLKQLPQMKNSKLFRPLISAGIYFKMLQGKTEAFLEKR